jgi:hypothetical protein
MNRTIARQGLAEVATHLTGARIGLVRGFILLPPPELEKRPEESHTHYHN